MGLVVSRKSGYVMIDDRRVDDIVECLSVNCTCCDICGILGLSGVPVTLDFGSGDVRHLEVFSL